MVYADVRAWHEIAIPEDVRDAAQLEAFVAKEAVKRKISGRPFPFAVKGTFEKLSFHILNKTDNKPHNREIHDRVKVHFKAEQVASRLVGFHSDRHQGVFTNQGTNVHMHVITDDDKQSGHAESFRLGIGSVLLLPKDE